MTKFLAALALIAAATFANAQTVEINGAGATFPNPIYSKWFSEYHKAHPNVEINYQSIGSGGGIRQLSAGTVFFGASDGPMTNEQIQAAGFRILHLPTVLSGVVPVYNVPGVQLHRPPPRRHLPRQDHEVERRGDLGQLAGGRRRQRQRRRGRPGQADAGSDRRDFRVSITNAPGSGVYPISSFTWLLVQEAPKDVQRSRIVADFIRWALTEGQKFAPQLGYAPLPREVVALEMEALKRIRQ